MKLQILLSLLILPLLANAEDPYRHDPEPLDSCDRLLKPLKVGIPDCTLKPPSFEPYKPLEDPLGTRERKGRHPLPEKCVITTYSVPEPAGDDYSLSNIKTIIDYDPRTGEGKVYAADMFGKTLKGQVGVVKKESYSGNLIVYPSDNFGNADYLKPSKVIEGVEPSVPGRDFRGCERWDGIPHTTSSNAKIYQSDELGRRSLFAEPVESAKVECER